MMLYITIVCFLAAFQFFMAVSVVEDLSFLILAGAVSGRVVGGGAYVDVTTSSLYVGFWRCYNGHNDVDI